MTTEFLCCNIGARPYALRAGDVMGIVRADAITRAQQGNRAGAFVTHAGVAVPVFSAAAHLGLSQRPDVSAGHVLVTGTGPAARGWLVDRILRRSPCDDRGIAALPSMVGEASRRLFEGLIVVDGQSMLVLHTRSADHGGHGDARAHAGPSQPVHGVPRLLPQPASSTAPLLIAFASSALHLPARTLAAVSVKQVREVLRVETVVPVPNAPRAIRGIAPWRGVAVPVVDFGPANHHPLSKVLIAQDRGRDNEPVLMAVPIDRDARLHRVSDDWRRVTAAGPSHFVHGFFAIGPDRVGLIDIEAVAAAVADTGQTPTRRPAPAAAGAVRR